MKIITILMRQAFLSSEPFSKKTVLSGQAQKYLYPHKTLLMGVVLGACVTLLSLQALSVFNQQTQEAEKPASTNTSYFFEQTEHLTPEQRWSRIYRAINPFITDPTPKENSSLEGKNYVHGKVSTSGIDPEHPHYDFIESLNITPQDSVSDIAQKALGSDRFLALALMVENIPPKPYIDAAGVNVGAGYCITKRAAALGEEKVAQDLAFAGFSKQDIKILLHSKSETALDKITVSKEQAISLLMLTKHEYESMAKKAVGAPFFDALKPEKQDTLTYLTYNTGGLHTFKKLVQAIRSAQPQKALEEMTPRWRSENGKWNMNHRLRAWAQASFLGKPLEVAIQDPHAFEKKFAHKKGERAFLQANESLIEQKEKEQKRLFKTQIPQEFQKVVAQQTKTLKQDKKTQSGTKEQDKKGTHAKAPAASDPHKKNSDLSQKLAAQRDLKSKQSKQKPAMAATAQKHP